MTPAALGYRMPAEWEPHAATWLSWPRADGICFPGGGYTRAVPALVKMVGALAESEPVHINVCSVEHEAEVRRHLARAARRPRARQVFPHPHQRAVVPRPRPDFPDARRRRTAHGGGAISTTTRGAGNTRRSTWTTMCPCAWRRRSGGLPVYRPGIVLEGGSIDVNGAGTLLTTESCLLNPNRNPTLKKAQIEAVLKDYLGVRNVLWLGDGIEGDDTDGHVDDLTRFVNRTTVVTVIEEDEHDPNHEPLQANLHRLREMSAEDGSPLHVLTLPMPSKIVREGQRLPASYANFYIGNRWCCCRCSAIRTTPGRRRCCGRRFPGGGSCASTAAN